MRRKLPAWPWVAGIAAAAVLRISVFDSTLPLPGGIYGTWIASAASIFFSIAALILVVYAERFARPGEVPFGALILGFSSTLVSAAGMDLGHSVLFFLSSAIFLCLVRWSLNRKILSLAAAAVLAGLFTASSRFFPIDSEWFSPASSDAWAAGRRLMLFAGPGHPALIAALVGLAVLYKKQLQAALALTILILACLGVFKAEGWALVAVIPALGFLAGEGIACLGARARWVQVSATIIVIVPGLVLSTQCAIESRRPDTRQAAAQWLEQHVPPGEAILLDHPRFSPNLSISPERCMEISRRLSAQDPVQSRRWEERARRQSKASYRVYYVLHPDGRIDPLSLDVRSGIDPVRAIRARWIVTSRSLNSKMKGELSSFYSELAAEADLRQEFPAIKGVSSGPWLRIWSMRQGAGEK